MNKPYKTSKLIDLPSGNYKKIDTRRITNYTEEENINSNKNDPNLKEPDTWVKKWVDNSSKHRIEYLLNNGYLGFLRNSTIVIIKIIILMN